MGQLNVFTYTLTDNSMNIDASDNVVRISVICSSGVITIDGNVIFKGLSSNAVTLATGQGITITSPNVSLPLDGFVIDAPTSSDAADIVISYQ
jgi:hypothetical protein